MRVSKWWQIFHFERTNPLKSCPLPAAITYVEQNQVNHQQKPCIYLAMTFLFSMVSVMVIDLGQIKHFFLQWMIPVSYLRFLYLSVWSCEGQVLKAWHLFPLQHFLTWMLILEHLFLFSPRLYRLHYWNKTSQYWAVFGHPSVLQCCWCLLNSWGRRREAKVGVCHIFPGQLPSAAHTFMNADRSDEIPLKITVRSWPFDLICKFWIALH